MILSTVIFPAAIQTSLAPATACPNRVQRVENFRLGRGECEEVRSMECEVESVKCEVRSARNGERMWSVDCEVAEFWRRAESVKCGVETAECGVETVECGMSSVGC